MEERDDLRWRKSSHSGANGGDCVEVGAGHDLIAVRDTRQDGGGPVLMFSTASWRDFAGQIKAAAHRA
jgi:hypothetical protein